MSTTDLIQPPGVEDLIISVVDDPAGPLRMQSRWPEWLR